MDEQNQILEVSCNCGNERENDNYHRLYIACKKCASIQCAKYYQKNREKYWKNLDFIEKIIKIKLNKTEKILIHTQKIYKIFTIN